MTSGIAFDRPDRLRTSLSRLRAFPYDRFKIYMIVPIVRIELNSSQSSGSFAIAWVAFPYDRSDRLNIFWGDWDDRDDLDNHMETKLNSL